MREVEKGCRDDLLLCGFVCAFLHSQYHHYLWSLIRKLHYSGSRLLRVYGVLPQSGSAGQPNSILVLWQCCECPSDHDVGAQACGIDTWGPNNSRIEWEPPVRLFNQLLFPTCLKSFILQPQQLRK